MLSRDITSDAYPRSFNVQSDSNIEFEIFTTNAAKLEAYLRSWTRDLGSHIKTSYLGISPENDCPSKHSDHDLKHKIAIGISKHRREKSLLDMLQRLIHRNASDLIIKINQINLRITKSPREVFQHQPQ